MENHPGRIDNDLQIVRPRTHFPLTIQIMKNASKPAAPDLTRRPPRSPRVRLGGYNLLPRIIDKCRATLAGRNGEYNYACPLDERFFDFVGIDPKAFKKQVAKGLGDGALLDWVQKHATRKHNQPEIVAWSNWGESRGPTDPEGRKYFNELHKKAGPKREDISSWFDLLDLDDHVSFGGRA